MEPSSLPSDVAGPEILWGPEASPPSETKNWWWNVAILLLAIGGMYAVFHFRPFRVSGGTKHPQVGTPLPIVELESVEPGQKPLGREDLQGQVVVICFWGPWSPLSREALPWVAAKTAPYWKRPEFRLLTVICPQQPSSNISQVVQEAQAALREWKVSVPVYVDREGNTLARFRARTGLERIPTVYLVDRRGTIQALWPGYQKGVERELQELLEEQFPETTAY